MKHLLALGLLATLSASALSQGPGPSAAGRTIYSYDGSIATNGWAWLEVTPENGIQFAGTGYGTVSNPAPNSYAFGAPTRMRVQTYLYVEGTLSGEYDVRGFGEYTGTPGNYGAPAELRVLTNRNLVAVPYGFTDLLDAENNVVGNLEFRLQWAFGAAKTPVNGYVSGSPAIFNGVPLPLAITDPALAGHNGQFTLQLSRNLVRISENALGDQTYTAQGSVYLSVTN